MSMPTADCRSSAEHCEDKMTKVRVLLTTKSVIDRKLVGKRRPKREFIDPTSIQEVYEENLPKEDGNHFPGTHVMGYNIKGVVTTFDYNEIDGPVVKTEKAEDIVIDDISTTTCFINQNETKEKTIDIILDKKECVTSNSNKIDVTDENKNIKMQLISTCEDKVARLKALLSGRRCKTKNRYSHSIIEHKKTENDNNNDGKVIKTNDEHKLITKVHNTSDNNSFSKKNCDNNITKLCNSHRELLTKNNEICNISENIFLIDQNSSLDRDSILIQERSPDSCYASIDVSTDLQTESFIDSSDLDSDSDSGHSNLLHSVNFAKTVNDLTDESLYEENGFDTEAKCYFDSDDDVERVLDTICEEPDDVIVGDINDQEQKLMPVLVSNARKIEKKLLPSKQVTFTDAPPKVHVLRVWAFAARQARPGHWQRVVLDRERFTRRIADVDMAISWVLKPQHRARVKFQRFMPWWHAQRRLEVAEKKAKEVQAKIDESQVKNEHEHTENKEEDNDKNQDFVIVEESETDEVHVKNVDKMNNELKQNEIDKDNETKNKQQRNTTLKFVKGKNKRCSDNSKLHKDVTLLNYPQVEKSNVSLRGLTGKDLIPCSTSKTLQSKRNTNNIKVNNDSQENRILIACNKDANTKEVIQNNKTMKQKHLNSDIKTKIVENEIVKNEIGSVIHNDLVDLSENIRDPQKLIVKATEVVSQTSTTDPHIISVSQKNFARIVF